MVCYYMGSSLIGYAGGLAWTAAAWPGVLVLVGAALALGLVVAIGLSFLEPLPGNLPSGAAEKLGS
jgi:YNFM family putative membrane transporter